MEGDSTVSLTQCEAETAFASFSPESTVKERQFTAAFLCQGREEKPYLTLCHFKDGSILRYCQYMEWEIVTSSGAYSARKDPSCYQILKITAPFNNELLNQLVHRENLK